MLTEWENDSVKAIVSLLDTLSVPAVWKFEYVFNWEWVVVCVGVKQISVAIVNEVIIAVV